MTILWLFLMALALPDVLLTPGLTRPLTRAAVCGTPWGKDRRHVTTAMRKRVLAAYGYAWADRKRFEVDHLIPRELGGADDVQNLWPQNWPEAHLKDREENRLHRAVCAGTLTLDDAQQQMRQWGR